MIKKVKTKLLSSVKNKRLNVFFMFLLSAFVILIFTKLSKEYTNTIAFGIKKVNVPEEKVILNDSNNILNITLKTHGFNWLKYYFDKPQVTIDFSKEVYSKGRSYVFTKSVSYLNEKKQFQNKVKLLNLNPDTLVFRYDINLVKKVPISVNADIEFAPGYDILGDYKVKPDSATVVGPYEIVRQLDKLETELIVLNGVKQDISRKVKLVLPENRGNLKFSVKKIELLADVEKFTEGTVKIPVTITNLPDSLSIKYFPKEIKVSYYTSLGNFSNISANDFEAVCDFKKANVNQSFLMAELVKTPKGVKHLKQKQQRIEFIIIK